jgi:hypothetical protein
MFSATKEQMEKLQKYYREEGVHPSVVAKDIVNGVRNNSGTILSGKDTSKIAMLKRILPSKAFQNLILKQARKIGYLPS